MAADQFAMELPGSIKRLQAVIGEEVSIKSIKNIKSIKSIKSIKKSIQRLQLVIGEEVS